MAVLPADTPIARSPGARPAGVARPAAQSWLGRQQGTAPESLSPSGQFLRALGADIFWNAGSLVIAGVCGIGLNFVIGLFYDADTLGVFNQAFAVYIVLSQIAVGGCHASVLKHVAQRARPSARLGHVSARGDCPNFRGKNSVALETARIAAKMGLSPSARLGHIILPALLVTLVFAAATTALFWFTRHWVGALLESPGVAVAIAWATPGLFFFALNKVLMAALCGLGRLGWYAVYQAARPLLILAAILAAAIRGTPGDALTAAFSVAETVVFFNLLWTLAPNLRAGAGGRYGHWLLRHAGFGLRGLPGGLLSELNTRVDILTLGFFASDRITGIYSFAAILAEGVMQLPIAIRTAYTPRLARLLAAGAAEPLGQFLRHGKRVAMGLMLLAAGAALAVYPLAVRAITSDPDLLGSWPLFAILILGICAASRHLPFGQALLLAGRPGLHSLMVLSVVAVNFGANLALIPTYGMTGAALANAATQVCFVLALKATARRGIGLAL
jgi:O-antigen/teichoic acid export membrane protein